ncbi:MAG: hypothetical protein ABFS17_10385, partial [Chloroflexota bacterium]
IIRANNGVEYYFYELTGDKEEALHFSDFEGKLKIGPPAEEPRIRLGMKVEPEADGEKTLGKIKLLG